MNRLDRYQQQQQSSITNRQQEEYEEHRQHRQFRDENPRQSSTRMPSPVRNIYQRKRRTVMPRNEPRNEPRIETRKESPNYPQQTSAPDETYLSPTEQHKQQTTQDTERLQILLEEQVGALQTLNDRMHRVENDQERRRSDSNRPIRHERETNDRDTNTYYGPPSPAEIDSLRRRFAKQQASIVRLQNEISALSEKTKPARAIVQNENTTPQISLDSGNSGKEKGWLVGALVVAGILVLLLIIAIFAYKCINAALVAKRATPSFSTSASTNNSSSSFPSSFPSSASLTNSLNTTANSAAAATTSIVANSDRTGIASVASSAPHNVPVFQPQPYQPKPYQSQPHQQNQQQPYQQFVPGYYVAMPVRPELSERNMGTWSDVGVGDGGGNTMLSASGRAALSASAMQILREQQRQDIREALHEAIASISFHHQQVANAQTGSTNLVNVANAAPSPLQSAQYGEVVLGPQ